MRYLVLIDEKPAGFQYLDNGEPHLFYADPRNPARIFDSYEQARNMMRRVQRHRKRVGIRYDHYRVQPMAWPWQ